MSNSSLATAGDQSMITKICEPQIHLKEKLINLAERTNPAALKIEYRDQDFKTLIDDGIQVNSS